MTPDAFRRFLLLVACVALVVGLGGVWLYLAWVLALVAGGVGALLALLLSLEQDDEAERGGAEVDQPAREGLSRLEIRRRAEGRR